MLRKRNGSTPARLTRGISQKALDTTDSAPSPIKSPTRTFLLETPVQFTTVRKILGNQDKNILPIYLSILIKLKILLNTKKCLMLISRVLKPEF